jgi:arsenical pump membrane protein
MRRLHPLDWVALGLLIAGIACAATGLLPWPATRETVERTLPLLAFLGTVVVLAELTAGADVFDVIAARLAIAARGRVVLLFALCVAFASITTVTLSLDTTAVLLTPVMLALARKLDVNPLPLAMTTVWLANTASLLLPVSNLTNLLAAGRVGLSPLSFAGRMWLPQLVAIVVTAAFLWLLYWRKVRRLAPLDPHRPRDPVLYRVAFAACVLFVTGVLVGVPLWIASGVAAVIVVAAYAWRDRKELKLNLVPFRLLAFVSGMLLVMQTIGLHGLDHLAHLLIGDDGHPAGIMRAAFTGAGLSNVVNNLPAYLAGEAVVPLQDHIQLLALLVGTNVGPLATPWASLATLLWYERCHADGVDVRMKPFMLTGALLAVVATALSGLALLLT